VSKVILSGFILVPASDLSSVLEQLSVHIDLTRNESGCLIFNVEMDADDECKFHVYEEFVDKTAFEKHQQRVQSSLWGRVTKNVKRSYAIEGI